MSNVLNQKAEQRLLEILWPDIGCFLISTALYLAYQSFVLYSGRKDPYTTLRTVMRFSGGNFVKHLMQSGSGTYILGIQALRNHLQVTTFFASSSFVASMGVAGYASSKKFPDNVPACALTCVMFLAFFCWSQCARTLVQVMYMFMAPLPPDLVNRHWLRAQTFHRVGLRAFYFSFNIALWDVLGPYSMLICTLVELPFFWYLDTTEYGAIREEEADEMMRTVQAQDTVPSGETGDVETGSSALVFRTSTQPGPV
eukprot:TRINITY_DN21424_c0_g1_i1.p1 TRINITY_DN21424_c0_g1~~TRINITY_DN21424_c0_g1_i1.p1  ORF type:complete len:255 (-),score=-9.63 TRINITY_DN21424_c0_g1_i1:174-938(-)